MAKRRNHLVDQHMEHISARVFEQYQHVIREQIGRQHGIYALYRRSQLYYVGLASNLKGRLGAHLRDRHHGLWDNFSVYLTTQAEHIRELELLVLRIVPTRGNKFKGRFPRSTDMKRDLVQMIRSQQSAELDALVGRRHTRNLTPREIRAQETVLGPYLDRRLRLKASYKGNEYRASVRPDGWIRYNGYLYASPSDLASEIVGRRINGWHFWFWERSPKKWERLKTLKG